jgi:hypothetical protein
MNQLMIICCYVGTLKDSVDSYKVRCSNFTQACNLIRQIGLFPRGWHAADSRLVPSSIYNQHHGLEMTFIFLNSKGPLCLFGLNCVTAISQEWRSSLPLWLELHHGQFAVRNEAWNAINSDFGWKKSDFNRLPSHCKYQHFDWLITNLITSVQICPPGVSP